MKTINEEFLHFLWKNQQLTGVTFTETGDFKVKVLDPGIHNFDSGPDFFNARVDINKTLWAGNVELHINSSDWLKHGHSNDPAYDSVILHVVFFHDCEITRPDGQKIPTVVLRFPGLLWDTYTNMMNNNRWIACQDNLWKISPLHIAQWTSSLLVEKLQNRFKVMHKSLFDLKNQWDALLNREIFRAFGVPVNSSPFEMLALGIPYEILLRQKESLFSTEAILFGQSGMLHTTLPYDKYAEALKHEYLRFESKFSAPCVPLQSWKYMRMRPSSFPSLRIAQLAATIHKNYPPFGLVETIPSFNDIKESMKLKASDYWNTHYQFGKESKSSLKYLGDDFIKLFTINCLVPFMFFYGKTMKRQVFCDQAIAILESLPPESNVILKKWGTFGIVCNNAFESQAIIFLYKSYCKQKRCLECQFGNNLIIDEKKQE